MPMCFSRDLVLPGLHLLSTVTLARRAPYPAATHAPPPTTDQTPTPTIPTMTKAHREMENVGRTAGHGPYKCQECGAPSFRPRVASFVVAFSPPTRVHPARRRGPSMHPPRPFFSDALDTSEMRINSRSHHLLAHPSRRHTQARPARRRSSRTDNSSSRRRER